MRACSTGWLPKNKSLNGFIPALMNIKVGSSFTTMGAEGTIWCPFSLKNPKKSVECDVIPWDSELQGESTCTHSTEESPPLHFHEVDTGKIPIPTPCVWSRYL